MNAASVLLDRGLSALQAVAGETIAFSWGTCPAVVSAVDYQDEYQLGGHNVRHAITVAVRNIDLKSSPAIGDLITYGGNVYQVLKTDRDLAGMTITASETSV